MRTTRETRRPTVERLQGDIPRNGRRCLGSAAAVFDNDRYGVLGVLIGREVDEQRMVTPFPGQILVAEHAAAALGLQHLRTDGIALEGLNFAIPVGTLKEFLHNRSAFAFEEMKCLGVLRLRRVTKS